MGIKERRHLKSEMLTEAVLKYKRDYLDQDNLKMASIRMCNIEKDFRDSVKPYKSSQYILRDLVQPFQGLYNLISGLFKLTVFPFILAPFVAAYYSLAYYLNIRIAFSIENIQELTERMKEIVNVALGVAVDGAAQFLHGIIQVIKTPYTWMTQVPYRILITSKKGWQKFDKNEGVRNLIDEYKRVSNSHRGYTVAELIEILLLLEEKYEKAIYKTKQHNSIDYNVMNNLTHQFIQTLPKKNDFKGEEEDNNDKPRPYLFERRYSFKNQSSVLSLFHHNIDKADLKAPLTQDNIKASIVLIETVIGEKIRKTQG